jgi:YHS domain-containing protein
LAREHRASLIVSIVKIVLEPSMITRRIVLKSLTLGAAVGLASRPAIANAPPIYTGLVKGVGAGGYDTVAFITESTAKPGKADLTLEHAGVTWRFASAANRDAFKADPARYVPQYGGYCAWAVANGYTAKGDPEAWSVVDGKLYLNYNKSVRAGWLKDTAANIKKGDANWPAVLAKPPR